MAKFHYILQTIVDQFLIFTLVFHQSQKFDILTFEH